MSTPLSLLPPIPGMNRKIISTPVESKPTKIIASAVIPNLRIESMQKVRDKKATIALFLASKPHTLVCILRGKEKTLNFDSSLTIQFLSDTVVQVGDLKVFWKSQALALKFSLFLLYNLSNSEDLTHDLKTGDSSLPLEEDDDYLLEASQWRITKKGIEEPDSDSQIYKKKTLPPVFHGFIENMCQGGIRAIFRGSKKTILLLNMKEIHPPIRRIPTSRVYAQMHTLEINTQRLITIAENISRRKKLIKALSALKARSDALDAQLDINAVKIESLKNAQSETSKNLDETARLMRRVDIDDNLLATREANERSFMMETMEEAERKGDEIRLKAMGKTGSEKSLTKCIAEMYEAASIILSEDKSKSYEQRLESVRLQLAETIYL